MNSYLEMVRVYLSQELPPPYNNLVSVVDDSIRITLPASDTPFNEGFSKVHSLIIECINRVRDLQHNLNFTVWSEGQLRDFTINKET